jgi:hypothetical protein
VNAGVALAMLGRVVEAEELLLYVIDNCLPEDVVAKQQATQMFATLKFTQATAAREAGR